MRRRIGLGVDDQRVGIRAVGDPHLVAIEQVVAPFVLGSFRIQRQLDESAAETFDLLLDRRPGVECFDDGPEPTRRADRLKPGDAGLIAWNELYTTDAETALAFYASLFGWKEDHVFDMGPMGKYRIFSNEGRQIGGMMNKPAEMAQIRAQMAVLRDKVGACAMLFMFAPG